MGLRGILAGLSFACTLGCNSTGVGNPPVSSTSLSLSIANDDEAEPAAEAPDAILPSNGLRHAILVLRELRWLPCDPHYEAVVMPGQIVVNLATARVEPALPEISVPPGGFCGLDAPLMPAQWPASLVGRSIFFAGLREDGTLFLLYSSVEGTLRVRAREGIAWAENGAEHVSLLWALRPRRWLLPSELDAAESVPIGEVSDIPVVQDVTAIERVIPIDADRYPVLLDLVRTRLAGRSTLHADSNGNDQLDLAERGDAQWLGTGLTELD